MVWKFKTRGAGLMISWLLLPWLVLYSRLHFSLFQLRSISSFHSSSTKHDECLHLKGWWLSLGAGLLLCRRAFSDASLTRLFSAIVCRCSQLLCVILENSSVCPRWRCVGICAVSMRLFCLFICITMAVISVTNTAPGTHQTLWSLFNFSFFIVRPGIPEIKGGDGVFVIFKWWKGKLNHSFSTTTLILSFVDFQKLWCLWFGDNRIVG